MRRIVAVSYVSYDLSSLYSERILRIKNNEYHRFWLFVGHITVTFAVGRRNDVTAGETALLYGSQSKSLFL